MSKRKRASQRHVAVKRPKLIASTTESKASGQILHPLLAHCYPQVKSLKDYLLAALPASSRLRRRRLLSLVESSEHAHFLTTTLVGWRGQVSSDAIEHRLAELTLFTQTCRTERGSSALSQQWTIDEVSCSSTLRQILNIDTGHRVRHLDPVQAMQWRTKET